MFGAMMITGDAGTYSGSSPGGVGGYGAYSYSYTIPAGSSVPSGPGTYASGAITSTGAAAPATAAEAAAASGSAPGGIVTSLLSSFGPFGERGPYTEINYPEMRFLRAGENPTELLSSLRTQATATSRLTPIGWAVLALAVFSMIKR